MLNIPAIQINNCLRPRLGWLEWLRNDNNDMERDSATTRLPSLRQGRKAEVLAVNWFVADFCGATVCMYGTPGYLEWIL